MGKEVNFGKLLHGGDYNPEQWMDYPEILEQDLAYFKKARINEVSLGMFSWAFLEPEEGVFRLEWLKEVIDRLYENEIVVMLSTPTAARPRWMAEKYPEVLRVNAARERNLYGERHNHCYTCLLYTSLDEYCELQVAGIWKRAVDGICLQCLCDCHRRMHDPFVSRDPEKGSELCGGNLKEWKKR